jgi:WbqC-like protein
MQPYFLPYIGYFQLIEHCDVFVVYDDIEYTKSGWINRNRILASGAPRTISLPLRRASDYLDVRDREIAPEYSPKKLLALLQQSYGQAPFWATFRPLLESVLSYPSRNLFDFVANSISAISACLDIDTDTVVSSSLAIDRSLRGEERVLATCATLGATEYVNPIGGLHLYGDSAFAERGVRLSFLRSGLSPYAQFSYPYVEALSIIDAMMFVEPLELRSRVRTDYEIVNR